MYQHSNGSPYLSRHTPAMAKSSGAISRRQKVALVMQADVPVLVFPIVSSSGKILAIISIRVIAQITR